MQNLTPVIPGFYSDGQGHLYLNMREFLAVNGMPDSPEVRAVVWDEVRDIFGEIPVLELQDWIDE
jgi:hypothetical protein